jgi:hypothetical protein
MVCTERTIGWEIILWTDPMVPIRDVGHVEAHFNPVGVVLILTQDGTRFARNMQ